MVMLSVHYHELMEKIEEHEGKIFDGYNDYMLDKVLKKINRKNRHCEIR